ncbi:DUF6053 domain-containing protein [Lysobacter yananisis]|uniref:DUF6053 domain-containing protein n=1 Tax=Lysobacter yananisis TaxID=1003114 RepID=UPI003CE546D2
MGGASAPMPFVQTAAIWNKSVGPEGPPTTARALRRARGFCGRGFSPDAFRSGRGELAQEHRA